MTYLHRYNLSSCSATALTNVGAISLPQGANSLTFLADGTALIGTSTSPIIYRITIIGNNYTLAEWISIPDTDINGSAGDFILLGSNVYAAILKSDYTIRIYKILVNSSYNSLSIEDQYDNTDANLLFGMTSYNGMLYGGFDDGTIKRLDLSVPGTLTYSPNLLDIPETSIYGMTSMSEAFGLNNNCNAVCYKPGLLTGGTILDTPVGITTLNRAGEDDADNWPMTRKGGWIALEAKTKGLVPNRVAFANTDGNPLTPDVPVGIPETDFVEGMMVYDTTNHCLKIYTSMNSGASFEWYCLGTQTCPD